MPFFLAIEGQKQGSLASEWARGWFRYRPVNPNANVSVARKKYIQKSYWLVKYLDMGNEKLQTLILFCMNVIKRKKDIDRI